MAAAEDDSRYEQIFQRWGDSGLVAELENAAPRRKALVLA
eukprot:CAMPEP_0203882676 /NCGR_PEP_ID=MMETSP0359-20131031/26863_1 /ASSEMBLY_ACC=CAM_ASM_000338 /TAXON_ID=268821 /ORGANISM="Scrippsiella Hangoei, Strain SHTV-5" /LENGTH=39 /DNA_ID= /DNA_START= /DNA_END= /DNA_ORIENTATION=